MTGHDLRVGTSHAQAERSDPLFHAPPRAKATIFGRSRYAEPGPVPEMICLHAADPSGDMFRIVVAGADGGAIAALGPFGDEDAVAIWRALGATSGLPLALADSEGAVHAVAAQIGRLHLGSTHTRRRVATAGRRRPRFLARRKSASLPRRPLVYREPELAARQDGR